MDFNISEIITSLKSSYGKDFLDTITMQLHKAIHADYTFIARLDSERNVSQTLSLVAGDDFGENFEYSLDNTPCADVNNDTTCIYPENICSVYPDDQLLVDMGIEGYIGAPLHKSTGEVFGIVVGLFSNKIDNPNSVSDLFELFSGRIAIEIERSEKEEQINRLNDNLEALVEERTSELSQAITQLKQSQDQLVQQEKHASLGRLVAGVAHEVNTPLGVATLAASTIASKLQDLQVQFTHNALSKSKLNTYIDESSEAFDALLYNLRRASEQISSFKQMASAHYADDESEIEVTTWLGTVVDSLKPLLKKSAIDVHTNFPDFPVNTKTYPSRLSQVIANIMSNVVDHAFPSQFDSDGKRLDLSVEADESAFTITVADNGVGMEKHVLDNALEPFYTTRRQHGGMGLGMSIVHNLVTDSLNGKMEIISNPGQGTQIKLYFSVNV